MLLQGIDAGFFEAVAIRSQEPLNPKFAWRPINVLLLQLGSEDLPIRART